MIAVLLPASDLITPLVTTNTVDLLPSLLGVAGIGLIVGGTVLALKRGWGLFKSFAR